MASPRALLLLCPCLLGLVVAGCGPAASIHVETTIHPDGSCDRTIRQPRDEYLPAAARKPDWKALWKTVSDATDPPETGNRLGRDRRHYVLARGTFPSPREIPPHYEYADKDVPDVGKSELRRAYERTDYGFVIEHRWREEITNIVTLAGFLKGRDDLLALYLPLYTNAIEKTFGPVYDVSRLVSHLRTNGKRFLENASLILYGAIAGGRVVGDDGVLDTALVRDLFEEADRCGFDRRFLDLLITAPGMKQSESHTHQILSDLMIQYFRCLDGAPVVTSEADAFVRAVLKTRHLDLMIQEEMNGIEQRILRDEKLLKRRKRAILRMTGLFSPFQFFLTAGPPEFEFAISLPGDLVETNGIGTDGGRTRWRFNGEALFPDGYEMKARSLFIDRDGQRKALGRMAIDNPTTAIDYMDLVGKEGPLLDAARALRRDGDRDALRQVKSRTYAESQRAKALRKMLLEE